MRSGIGHLEAPKAMDEDNEQRCLIRWVRNATSRIIQNKGILSITAPTLYELPDQ